MANRAGNPATSTEVIPAGHAALTAEEELGEHRSDTSTRLPGLSVAALGVVFGDIGTSPVYTFRECFNPEHGLPLDAEHVLGALSMIFWSSWAGPGYWSNGRRRTTTVDEGPVGRSL